MALELERLLGWTLSLGMCLLCGVLAIASFRRTREIFTPWTVFLAMAVGDVYLPSLIFLLNGLPAGSPWIPQSTDEMMVPAIGLFTIGMVLFAIGYGLADSATLLKKRTRVPLQNGNRIHLSLSRVYTILIIAGLVYGVRLASDVVSQGSVLSYLNDRLTNRFPAEALSGRGIVDTMLSLSVLPIFLVMTALVFSRRTRKSKLRGFLAPLLGLLAAATTLFRGSILGYVIGLTVIESQRMQEERWLELGTQKASPQPRIRRVVLLAAAGVLLFSFYGSVRNFLTAKGYGLELSPSKAAKIELQQFIRGEGLIGFAAILDYYPQQAEFFNGKTIFDMLLLPVPRAIWPEKPLWYGIDDITRGMGWPRSTQSPVTMPGELYANFGYSGVLLMLLYGLTFGYFHRQRYGPRFRYVYAFVIVPMMMAVFWMGFSAFVNHLIIGLPVGVILLFVLQESPRASKMVFSQLLPSRPEKS